MCCGLEAISLQYVLWTAGDQSTICIVDWRGSVCNMCCGLEAISLQYVLWTGGGQSVIYDVFGRYSRLGMFFASIRFYTSFHYYVLYSLIYCSR